MTNLPSIKPGQIWESKLDSNRQIMITTFPDSTVNTDERFHTVGYISQRMLSDVAVWFKMYDHDPALEIWYLINHFDLVQD